MCRICVSFSISKDTEVNLKKGETIQEAFEKTDLYQHLKRILNIGGFTIDEYNVEKLD